jgi:hypothetical protein
MILWRTHQCANKILDIRMIGIHDSNAFEKIVLADVIAALCFIPTVHRFRVYCTMLGLDSLPNAPCSPSVQSLANATYTLTTQQASRVCRLQHLLLSNRPCHSGVVCPSATIIISRLCWNKRDRRQSASTVFCWVADKIREGLGFKVLRPHRDMRNAR